MKFIYEAWVAMNADNDVITEEYATAQGALEEVLEKYTVEEAKAAGITVCKLLCDDNSWLECLEELQPEIDFI